jgi:predicted glycosyltransferase
MAHGPLRAVFYAVNGTGVGHLTRLLAIARWLRRYAAAAGERMEIWFLTTSEADALVFSEGFAAFKIPSKTSVAEAGIDRTAYVALAKQWVWHTLGLLRPDLFVVDTFPRGSFGELLGALDLCRASAFVYRPVKPDVAARPDFQAMLSLYGLVLVPETDHDSLVPDDVRDRLVHIGPVLLRERWELLPRDVARERLGVRAKRCVFVSAGGGGDRNAEAEIARTVTALSADPSITVVVGTGPLYRGRTFAGVTTLAGGAAEWMLAFDAAVCAAGYNMFNELMYAGVPTAFVPQDKLADDQYARAAHAVRRGAAAIVTPDVDVLAVVRDLLGRSGARDAARAIVPENGARFAAAELLRLVCAPARVDRVEAVLDDDLLARIATHGAKHEVDVFRVAQKIAAGEHDLAQAILRAAALLSDSDASEMHGLVDAAVRGLGPAATMTDRATAVQAARAVLGPLTPGDGAAARAAVAEARWGGEVSVDGAALARAIRAL